MLADDTARRERGRGQAGVAMTIHGHERNLAVAKQSRI